MSIAATIGHFDGVHLGHRHLISCLRKAASKRGIHDTMVITFDRLPRALFDPTYRPLMLTTLEERARLLRECGISRCEVLHFDHDMAAMSAYDFMKDVLYDRLNVRLLMLGYNNRFGKRQENEGFEDYVAYGKQIGIEVIACDEYRTDDGLPVSSSLIRSLIAEGKTDMADALLGKNLQ